MAEKRDSESQPRVTPIPQATVLYYGELELLLLCSLKVRQMIRQRGFRREQEFFSCIIHNGFGVILHYGMSMRFLVNLVRYRNYILLGRGIDSVKVVYGIQKACKSVYRRGYNVFGLACWAVCSYLP